MPKYLCALLALLTLTVAAGCGGDDGRSKEDYVKDLNKICKETGAEIRAVKSPRTIKQIGLVARKARPILQDRIERTDKLELPDEGSAQLQDYNNDFEKSLSTVDLIERAAATGKRRPVQVAFAKTIQENKKLDAKAKKLGLTDCVTG